MHSLLIFMLLMGSQQQEPVDLDNVPTSVAQCLRAKADSLEISRRMNQFYLRGDFNGDGKVDFVVLVQERQSKKQGFAFCFAADPASPHIVGAGTSLALEGGVRRDDLSAFDVWGVVVSSPKRPRIEALFLEQAEAGSGLLVWNGRKLVWRQLAV